MNTYASNNNIVYILHLQILDLVKKKKKIKHKNKTEIKLINTVKSILIAGCNSTKCGNVQGVNTFASHCVILYNNSFNNRIQPLKHSSGSAS